MQARAERGKSFSTSFFSPSFRETILVQASVRNDASRRASSPPIRTLQFRKGTQPVTQLQRVFLEVTQGRARSPRSEMWRAPPRDKLPLPRTGGSSEVNTPARCLRAQRGLSAATEGKACESDRRRRTWTHNGGPPTWAAKPREAKCAAKLTQAVPTTWLSDKQN